MILSLHAGVAGSRGWARGAGLCDVRMEQAALGIGDTLEVEPAGQYLLATALVDTIYILLDIHIPVTRI